MGLGAGGEWVAGTGGWAKGHDAGAYVSAVQSGRLPVEQDERLTAESAVEEELFLGLRQLDGIDLARIEREYGVMVMGRFDPLTSAGLGGRGGRVGRLGPRRCRVSNGGFLRLLRQNSQLLPFRTNFKRLFH